jgi:hypothetical protein
MALPSPSLGPGWVPAAGLSLACRPFPAAGSSLVIPIPLAAPTRACDADAGRWHEEMLRDAGAAASVEAAAADARDCAGPGSAGHRSKRPDVSLSLVTREA